MKLYKSDKAPNPMRVIAFLAEKGVLGEIEQVEVSIMEGQHKLAEFREKSPFGQVPVLELDDGTMLTESRAICTYLESVYPEPNLMGRDGKEKAVIEMWDRRMELLFLMPIAMWIRHAHPALAALEKTQCTEWAGINETRAKKMAVWLDRHLAENEFIAGDRFSIADITAYIATGFSRVIGFNAAKTHEHVGRWAKALKARPMGQA